MWINPITQQVFTAHHEIREAFRRHISLPDALNDDVIASLGIEPLPQEEWPAPTYDEQVRAIEHQFEAAIAAIKAGYTADEISSWPYQSAEARAWQADNNAPTPLIDAILLTRGGTKEELVTRILTNSAAYSEAFGQALGRKQAAIAGLSQD